MAYKKNHRKRLQDNKNENTNKINLCPTNPDGLKYARESRGLSQIQLHKNVCGCLSGEQKPSATTVKRWEDGQVTPRLDSLQALADATDTLFLIVPARFNKIIPKSVASIEIKTDMDQIEISEGYGT